MPRQWGTVAEPVMPLVDVAVEPPNLPPAVRVVATYPATDGSAPESIEIVWEVDYPTDDGIVRIIAALAAVTRRVDDHG